MDGFQKILLKATKHYRAKQSFQEILQLAEHWNGYQREEAVTQLQRTGNIKALPALIIRANDWVPQVRNAAYRAINSMMKQENAFAFLSQLPAVEKLQDCGRANHKQLVESIYSLLANPENAALLIRGLEEGDVALARICVRLAIRFNIRSKEELVSIAFQSTDTIVRFSAAKLLRSLQDGKKELVTEALTDSFMPTRREAFQIAISEKYLTPTTYVGFLFDKHVAVRELAIQHAEKFQIDPLKEYKAVLLNDGLSVNQRKFSIWGISQLGDTTLLPIILCLLNSPSVGIRKQALTALVNLDTENAPKYLIEKLQDKAAGVIKLAARLMLKQKIPLLSSELVDISNGAESMNTYQACLFIAKSINKWERFIFFLESLPKAIVHEEGTLLLLESAMHRWHFDFNKDGTQPSKNQIATITDKLNCPPEHLDPQLVSNMCFGLDAFGIDTSKLRS